MVGVHRLATGTAHPAMSRWRDMLHAFNDNRLSFDRIDVFPDESDDNCAFHTIMNGIGTWNGNIGVHNLPNVRSLMRKTHVALFGSISRGRL